MMVGLANPGKLSLGHPPYPRTHYTQAPLYARDAKGAMSSSRGAAARGLTRRGKWRRRQAAGIDIPPSSPPSPHTQ